MSATGYLAPLKFALAGAALAALSLAFVFQRTPAPLVLPTEQAILAKNVQAIVLAQMPFDAPDWVPDEVTKKKALMRAYELNGDSMAGERMIDVSKEDLTERVTADQPADPNERNALDAQAEDRPDWDARRRFMNRTFRATRRQLARHDEAKPKNVCERHGLHKVVYGDKWRCRK